MIGVGLPYARIAATQPILRFDILSAQNASSFFKINQNL